MTTDELARELHDRAMISDLLLRFARAFDERDWEGYAGAPVWIPDLFNGAALLIAVGMAKCHRTAGRASAVNRLIGDRLRRYAREHDGQVG